LQWESSQINVINHDNNLPKGVGGGGGRVSRIWTFYDLQKVITFKCLPMYFSTPKNFLKGDEACIRH